MALTGAALVLVGPAFSATYYVDAASLGGRCSDANAGTSSSAPWCSISKAGSAPSGSTVLVRRGTYDRLSLTGESDLTVEGYPGERPTLTNGALVSGRSLRVNVRRFRSTGLVEVRQSDRVVFSDIEIDGNRFGVSGARNVTVEDSWVHDLPPLLDKFGSFGIRVAPYNGERASNLIIRRNRVENLSNDPVQLSYVETALVEDNVFRNAHPTGNGEHVDTIHVLGGLDIVLRRNDGRAMQHGLMITDRVPRDGPDADNRAMTVENNIVQTDVGYSFNGPPGPNSRVVNNTLISPWGTSVRYTDSRDTSGTTSAGAIFGNNVVKNRLGVASEIVEDYNFADSGSPRGANTIIGRVSFEGDYGLPAGSPAVDSASTAWAPATDLNGYSRVGPPDRGAKERGGAGGSTPPPPPAACANGVDDDGDGHVDYPADPGCTDAGDDDETDPTTSPPPPPPPSVATTAISVSGEDFLVNGAVTYAGLASVPLATGGTADLRGLLLTSRMINGVFDDDNAVTRANWAYPDGSWDPERNTNAFVAQLDDYRAKGLLMVTVGLQGGNPADTTAAGNGDPPQWIVSGFDYTTGALRPAWKGRAERVLEAADDLGMIVTLQLFYQRQDTRFASEGAIEAAVDNTVDWLIAKDYRNVLLQIQNEVGSSYWDLSIFSPARAHELVQRARTRAMGRLLVGTSVHSDFMPTGAVVSASDFVAIHGNNLTASGLESRIASIRAMKEFETKPKPITVTEDSTSLTEMDAALRSGAGWGFHDPGYGSSQPFGNYVDGFQAMPAQWAINTATKRAFFDRVATYTTAVSTPPPPPPPPDAGVGPHELMRSVSNTRSSPVLLAGATVSGNVYVFTDTADDHGGISKVEFRLDGALKRTESNAPYDYAGGSTSTANAWDTRTVANGSHTIEARVFHSDGVVERQEATFTVSN